MQHKAIARTFLASVAILSLSLPSIALAGPNTKTRGPHGAAYIDTMDASFPAMAAKVKMTVTPFNLVFLGFQGFFASEKIPSALGFIQGARDGKITPEKLTQAAIKMNRLSPDTLQDKDYLDSVRSELDTIVRTSNN
ncbi:hypothetical protein [Altericista sp. CCNU0014]|uniref:hypothetical protein n=1 Tax=Altericista sp. CCNU0014 TaxID=3082949 RepID=UPI00384E4572